MNATGAVLLAVIAVAIAVTVLVLSPRWVGRAMTRRAAPTTIDGYRVEVSDPLAVDDRVLEVAWQIPVLMTNQRRHSAILPVMAGRAEVYVGRARHVGTLSFESEVYGPHGVAEFNPGGHVVAFVDVVLPAGVRPNRVELQQLRPHIYTVVRRFAPAVEPAS